MRLKTQSPDPVDYPTLSGSITNHYHFSNHTLLQGGLYNTYILLLYLFYSEL